MKKENFLNKLREEGKLELVEPSKELRQSYLEKSESNLTSAKILLNNNRLEEAVSLAYYSMYHALTALLLEIGIKCENHTASIILLKEIFKIDTLDIWSAKKERVDKQYYTDFQISKEEVIETIKKAEEFNKKILDFVSKLTNERIKIYRKRLKEILK